MRTNTEATVYNHYLSSGADKYQRTVIGDVAWENAKGKNILASGGGIEADQATIYIPMVGVTSGYLAPKAWLALTNKAGFWTLKPGDYIVKGSVSDEITTSPVFTMTDLKKKYDDVLQVSTVDTMDGGSENLHHWAVGAK